MKAEIEHDQFVIDCKNILSTQDSDLQDTWKNLYKGKSVSFLGEIDTHDERREPTINVITNWYEYHTWWGDRFGFIPCLEIILLPHLESDVIHTQLFYASGSLKWCERIRSSDSESGCASILRIFLESGGFESSSPSDDQFQSGILYTCD